MLSLILWLICVARYHHFPIMKKLLSKAKIEAEEAQRLLLASMNGLAAITLLEDGDSDGNQQRAIALYEAVLQKAREQTERFDIKTDDLQRIHALTNLSLLICDADADRASTLREQALELRKSYAKIEQQDFAVAQVHVRQVGEHLESQHPMRHFDPLGEPWWTRAASVLDDIGRGDDFVRRLKGELSELNSSSREGGASALEFRDIRGLVYVLRSQLQATWQARCNMKKQIESLSKMSDEDARKAGNCKVCRPWGKGPACAHCQAEKKCILGYEQRLFALIRDKRGANRQAAADREERARPATSTAVDPRLAWDMKEFSKDKKVGLDVSRSPAECEIALACLLRYITSMQGGGADLLALRDEGRDHVKVLGSLKQEFDRLRDLWLTQREVLYRTDELLMSEMRIQMSLEGEETSKEDQHYKLQSMEEVQTKKMLFESERSDHQKEFQEATDRFSYLRNLQIQQRLASDVQPCPVCHEPMRAGSDIIITKCGHSFCYFCIMKLYERFNAESIACPTCRRGVPKKDLHHVRDRSRAVAGAAAMDRAAGGSSSAESSAVAGQPGANAPQQVVAAAATAGSASATAGAAAAPTATPGVHATKGDFGSKIDHLVVLLQRIARSDATEKTIVFSQWSSVLQIAAVALEVNTIEFADAYSKSGRQQDTAVENFKSSSKVNVLLLATKSGANGLNLTEAVNVILVEPVLSPAVEAQAVSRVLRIGQTKETHVYRLIVEGTIEEKILTLQSQRKEAEQAEAAGVVGGRKSQDDLNVADIRALFDCGVGARASYRHNRLDESIDVSAESADGDAVSAFWKGLVSYNKRAVARHDAAQAMTTLYSFELKRGGKNIHDAPTFTMFGKTMALSPASRLLRLTPAQVETAALTERITSCRAMVAVKEQRAAEPLAACVTRVPGL